MVCQGHLSLQPHLGQHSPLLPPWDWYTLCSFLCIARRKAYNISVVLDNLLHFLSFLISSKNEGSLEFADLNGLGQNYISCLTLTNSYSYTYQMKDERNVEELYGLEVESQQEALSG